MAKTIINGFSKLAQKEKIELLAQQLEIPNLAENLKSYRHPVNQKLFDEFSENTLSNYYLPYGIAPNFLINGEIYHIPMVIEESSVVAAASSAARFWLNHGGFHAEVVSTLKTGQVHFTFQEDKALLFQHWLPLKERLYQDSKIHTINMEKRGGGIVDIRLEDCTHSMKDYFQLQVTVDTVDSMGANFINTVLEQMAITLTAYCSEHFPKETSCEITMSILSNYTPDCKVNCRVEAPVSAFDKIDGEMSSSKFIEKFTSALRIAEIDIHRAVTHNKGIMNGVDAVVLATGNDFRAVEAGIHAYASRNGHYASLSSVEVQNGIFIFSIEIPLAVGTVGGLTSLHPMAKQSLEILGNASAKQLMMIIAAAGLANHFSAIKALVTSGIQKGHMKMHLSNILHQLDSTDEEKASALKWFENKTVSYKSVRDFLNELRKTLSL